VKLTKWGHACVRVEHDGQALVIDPGAFTEPTALDGADALLITHEHVDHFAPERVLAAAETNPALRIWTNWDVAAKLPGLGDRVTVVGHGDAVQCAGIEVEVYGEWHAEIHRDLPRLRNTGFLLNGTVFHPGDALTAPDRPVSTLLLPLYAPWTTVGNLVDYLRSLAPSQALAVHDAAINEIGLAMLGGLLGDGGPGTGVPFTRLAPGESVDLV
jgi:L-ascorbate metabolism protein UlaG (beta-lactamase superfamily)